MAVKRIDFSVVIPFYNEEKITKKVIAGLISELDKVDSTFEIVAVDNGSADKTNMVIQSISKKDSRVLLVNVKKNEGYGNGIVLGLNATSGKIVGYMDGDGQALPKTTADCMKSMMKDKNLGFVTVWRKERNDGKNRKLFSFNFNLLMRTLFGVRHKDINAKPKFFTRAVYSKISPIESKDWFIDAEIAIKLQKQKLKIKEIPVTFYEREAGKSNVKIIFTALQFLKNMLKYKMRGY